MNDDDFFEGLLGNLDPEKVNRPWIEQAMDATDIVASFSGKDDEWRTFMYHIAEDADFATREVLREVVIALAADNPHGVHNTIMQSRKLVEAMGMQTFTEEALRSVAERDNDD